MDKLAEYMLFTCFGKVYREGYHGLKYVSIYSHTKYRGIMDNDNYLLYVPSSRNDIGKIRCNFDFNLPTMAGALWWVFLAVLGAVDYPLTPVCWSTSWQIYSELVCQEVWYTPISRSVTKLKFEIVMSHSGRCRLTNSHAVGFLHIRTDYC